MTRSRRSKLLAKSQLSLKLVLKQKPTANTWRRRVDSSSPRDLSAEGQFDLLGRGVVEVQLRQLAVRQRLVGRQ